MVSVLHILQEDKMRFPSDNELVFAEGLYLQIVCSLIHDGRSSTKGQFHVYYINCPQILETLYKYD